MAVNHQYSTKSLISKLLIYAKKQSNVPQPQLFYRFIKLYFSHASLEDLKERTIKGLYGLVLSHWQLFQQREPGQNQLRVFNPQDKRDGWELTHTVVELVTEDMPFLIDSMRMELDRLGLTTHLIIHMGGMSVRRDKQGAISAILPYGSGSDDSLIESPIYMEIDRQTDVAFLQEIQERLGTVIADVRCACEDWHEMQDRMREVINHLDQNVMLRNTAEIEETRAFLQWLLNDHFTFIGARDYKVVGNNDELALELVHGSGLGVLRDDTHSLKIREIGDMPEQAREMMLSKDQVLVISKTNTHSTIHRPAYTDYVGVKCFDEKGHLISERRFIGLYTSAAYRSDPKKIPLLRQKVVQVMKKSKLPNKSHAGKDLMHILTTLPRDDLFHGTVDELYHLSIGILHLQGRRRIRMFSRVDAYGRYISCLVYVPRENFNTNLLNQMLEILKKGFCGTEVMFSTQFSESILARIHYVIRVDPKKSKRFNFKKVEQQLIEAGQSWQDGFAKGMVERFGEEKGNALIARYRNAFPAGYQEVCTAKQAVYDVEHIERVSDSNRLEMSFYRPSDVKHDVVRFKLFHANKTVPLSDALPILENMGLRVIGEQPYKLIMRDGRVIWINDFNMVAEEHAHIDIDQVKPLFQEAFKRVWLGDMENDAFNRLIIDAQLDWRQVNLLRAYMKYLRQTGFTFSLPYVAETLIHNARITRLLVDLFECRFNPDLARSCEQESQAMVALIHEQLEEVDTLNEDRIIRRYLDLMSATLRTNYFQLNKKKQSKPYLSLKFNPRQIPDMPRPLPMYEIFVYSPRFEGVHLRAGKVARGGIRWSDRREDYRTEVLGLMKAQQVKNAVIVPSGAKGGFVPKKLPVNGLREEVLEEAIECYKQFISGLLDLTDNIKGKRTYTPANTTCYDDHDSYLVVAADKGTAKFSDIANNISIERGYWLGDAFASGGSVGYDHKKMGITARGAWISAERHFQELGINVDTANVSVVGIGDMAGDVFGNGMLLSQDMKLVCAFNHQHIFIDPNPDPKISYAERKRLFDLPRSSWTDYDRNLISPGGGVFSKNAKYINLTPEIKELLGVEKDRLIPQELMKAILKAPVDMIWNGGIGTFVKASTESNATVGDKGNDAIRVNADQLQARVFCEGGNLGLTQLARIEFELNGGKINTDFIDNSAGVDCSDHEVNIKILLNMLTGKDGFTNRRRSALLTRMTNEVAELVLQNNYHQNLAISSAVFLSPTHMGMYRAYIDDIISAANIDAQLECLPGHKTLIKRLTDSIGLTKPELSVLFSYSKILLTHQIRESDLIHCPYLSQSVFDIFPTPLRKRYSDEIKHHRLRDDIISTQLSNRLISDMGITFTFQMADETGADIPAIVRAYTAAREVFHMAAINADIESLDYKVDAATQYRMMDELMTLVRRATRWFLRNRRDEKNIQKIIDEFSQAVALLTKKLPKLLMGRDKTIVDDRCGAYIAAEVNHDVAYRVASAATIFQMLNVIEAAKHSDHDLPYVAKVYFTLLNELDLSWFRDQITAYPVEDRWSVLAKAAYKSDLDVILRRLTRDVLKIKAKSNSVKAHIQAWFEKNRGLIERWQGILSSLRSSDNKEFALLSVAIRELTDLTSED